MRTPRAYAALVVACEAVDAEHQVDLLEGAHDRACSRMDPADPARGPGYDGCLVAGEEPVATEGLAHQPDDRGVVEVAGGGDHHVGGSVVAPVEASDLVARERRDRSGSAGDRPAQGSVAPRLLGEEVVDHVVRVVVVHRDLVEDHVALRLDVVGVQQRVGDHVAEDVDRQRQVVVEHPRVEAGVLLGGERVELAADRVERHRDVHRAAAAGALEEQVLEEVRAAVQGGCLVARTDPDPHPDACRPDAGELLGDDPQPARQHRTPDARRHLTVGVPYRLERAGASDPLTNGQPANSVLLAGHRLGGA